MKVDEVMTRDVTTIQSSDSVRQAAERMRRLGVGAMPVLSGNDVVGIVTDRDIAVRAVALGKNPEETVVGMVMTEDVISCREDDDLDEAVRLMEERQIRRILVMNAEGRIAGILSLGDIAIRLDREKSGEVLREVSEPAATLP